ncbi:VOC family protein [Spirillospora sp. CA-253888]
MNLTPSSCALAVHDLDEALGFYRDVLGFEVRAGSEATGPVSVGPPSRPDVQIFLLPPGRRTVQDLPDRCPVFVTDDCDATFAHIEAAGAEVMQEPIDRPDGARDCAFLDPSGNMLRFSQPRQVNGTRAAQWSSRCTSARRAI